MSDSSKIPQENPKTRPPKERTDIRKIREGTQAFGEGPRVQITYLYGVFGETDGLATEEATQALRKELMGRIRLVITETGGTFGDLGRGRWSATLGADEPTEEDPLMAVTIGLKLMRLAALSRKSPPLRMVTVTGRVSQRSLTRVPLIDPNNGTLTGGHELLRLARKIVRECEPGMLCADGLTYQMIRDTHFCHRLTDLPGALANIPIYEVHSAAGSTNITYDAPLCGRSEEIERLKKVLARVRKGDGPVFFTITGDLGMGKSRLARAFVSKVEENTLVFRNPRERRRIDRWRRIPYSYFGEILRSFFAIYENEEMQQSREKLVSGLANLISAEDNAELSKETARYLGLLCQVYFPEDPDREEEDPAHMESRAFAALSQYLELASRNKPILFVLEDLYSADSSSLRLLKHLTAYLEPARILFLCVSRIDLLTELEQEAELHIPGERLLLQPLSTDAARRMIIQLLPEDLEFPESLCDRILRIADGNPFFLRESLRDLAEQGLFEALEQGDLEKLEIPQNIEGILQARISRLSLEERDILQKAAVFGKSFWRGGVEMLYRQEVDLKPGWRLEEGGITDRDDDLEQILETLVHKGVLQYQSNSDFEGEIQYNFMPSLMYEIAYQEIPEELRCPYHLLVGQWLELMASRRSSDINIEIAHHLDLGGAHEHAARYHIEIGIHSLKLYATTRAIKHLELGLQHLEPNLLEMRTQGLQQLAEAYILNGQYQEAITQYEELLDMTWRMGLRVVAGDAYTRMGWVYYLMRDFDNALSSMKNGHTLHQEMMYQRGITTALSNMGQVYMAMGDYQRARLFFQEALEIRREQNHQGDLAWALNNMGNLLLEQGNLVAAQKHHNEALEIRKSIGNPHQIIRSMNNLALIHVIQGNYDAALADLLVSSNLAQKVGEKLGMAIVMVNIGELYLQRGDLEQADKYIQQAMQLAEKLGDPWIQAECNRLRGVLLLEKDDRFGALDCCGKAYKLIMERGIRSALAQIYRLMGEVYASLTPEEIEEKGKVGGNRAGLPPFLFGNALACYEESIALAHRHGNLREEAKSRMMMGIYEVNRGNMPRGRYQLERAQATFEQLGMKHMREEVAQMLQEVDDFNTSASQPEMSKASLRPPRSKLANVDKTMIFRVNFDESEMGPPPSSAELHEFLSSSDDLDEDTLAGTMQELGLESIEQDDFEDLDRYSEQGSAEEHTLDNNVERLEEEQDFDDIAMDNHATIPAEAPMPPVETPTKEDSSPGIAINTTAAPKVHTLEVKSPVYSIRGQTSMDKEKPGHTLATQRAVSTHNEGSSSSVVSLPSASTEPPGEGTVSPRRASIKTPTPQTQVPQSLLERTRRGDDEKTAMAGSSDALPLASTSEDESTDVLPLASTAVNEPTDPAVPPKTTPEEPQKKKSFDDLFSVQEEDMPLEETPLEEEMHLETLDVVDTNAANRKRTQPPPPPRKKPILPPSAPVPSPPRGTLAPPSEEENGTKTVAVRAPKRRTTPPPPPSQQVNNSATTQESKTPGEALPPPPTPLPPLPSVMDILNIPVPIKKPSVYDSQVIIAQVAEDDDISREWFEAGRSDRQEKFWQEHPEDLNGVREELELEKLVEEIDDLKEK